MPPEKVVQDQLEAYNANNLEKFVSCYCSEIEIHDLDNGRPPIIGIEKLEAGYKRLFESSPDLESIVQKRIVFDNKVIDHEKVTGINGVDLLECVAIYEVNDELITHVTFINKSQ